MGVDATVAWLDNHAPVDALLFVDAPLVVNNETGQRRWKKQVGRRYGRWKVSANATNRGSPRLAGVDLLSGLEARGWIYHDGFGGPPTGPGRFVSECYPYATIVGAHELDYANERPQYKRKPRRMSTVEFLPLRNAECDKLICRVDRLKEVDPPMDLSTHPETRRLVTERSPDEPKDYKHREDLLDAALASGPQSSGVDGARLVARFSDSTKRHPKADGRPSSRRHSRNSAVSLQSERQGQELDAARRSRNANINQLKNAGFRQHDYLG